MKVNLKKGVSQKTNREYYCIEIFLGSNYKKVVFLDSAEIALIEELGLLNQ